jgi:hypothetical protein
VRTLRPAAARTESGTYGQQRAEPHRPDRHGLLHLLLVAIWLFQPKSEHHAPPKAGEAVVWLPPLKPNKPTPQAAQPAPKQSARTAPSKPKSAPRAKVQRLPDTITLPNEKPVEETKPQPKEETKLQPDETDMAAYIEKRRRPAAPAASSRRRRAKPARHPQRAGQHRRHQRPRRPGPERERRRVQRHQQDLQPCRRQIPRLEPELQAPLADLGHGRARQRAGHRDGHRQEDDRADPQGKEGDFEWDSHRLNKVVTLSARPQDTKELMDFLYKEMFPDYKPPK